MYKDLYPSLYQYYSAKHPTLNFEAIMAAMQQHFGDIFQLDVLEANLELRLINMPDDPQYMAAGALASLTKEKACYVLFGSRVFFIDRNQDVTPLNVSDLETFKSLFPKEEKETDKKKETDKYISLNGEKLTCIKLLTNHTPPIIIKGSYEKFFDSCMNQLRPYGTKEEVVRALYPLLHEATSSIREQLVENFIFTGKATTQIGYLEKMAVGKLEMAEPLTFVDMLRLVYGLNTLNARQQQKQREGGLSVPPDLPKIAVTHVNDLSNLGSLTESPILLVNFNSDLSAPPKWGVVDKQQTPCRVHCDMALTPTEKTALEAALGVIPLDNYLGATANHLPSTGYGALAWLDKNITKRWTFDNEADFAALVKDFLFVYFTGDAKPLMHKVQYPKEVTFYTKEFHRIASLLAHKDREDNDSSTTFSETTFHGGPFMWRVGNISALGQWPGDATVFKPGDMSELLKKVALMTRRGIVAHYRTATRTLAPGLLRTMSQYKKTGEAFPLLVSSDDDADVTLRVPSKINVPRLFELHTQLCGQINLSTDWVPSTQSEESELVARMLKAVIRGKAKKRHIQIELPASFEMKLDDEVFLLRQLAENAYVCRFTVNDHKSLQTIKQKIEPILARNRWLQHCGYKPPLTDNYWQQAVTYWLSYLAEHADVLQPLPEHEAFKQHIKEMGVAGLQELLQLQDKAFNDLPLLKEKKEKNKARLPFYAGYADAEAKEYLNVLTAHLASDKAFLYGSLSVPYSSLLDAEWLHLCRAIHTRNQKDPNAIAIEHICFSNIMEPDAFVAFLEQLKGIPDFVSLITIDGPLAEDVDVVAKCKAFNNIVLKKRELSSTKHVNTLNTGAGHWQAITSVIEDDAAAAGGGRDSPATKALNKLARVREEFNDRISSYSAAKHAWTHSEGASQLQLQQQMQIEQQQQVLPKKRTVVNEKPRPEIVTGKLVRFDNMDEFPKLVAPHPFLMSQLFANWISANPNVLAPGIIHAMTEEAAQVLLKKYRFLSSGLHLNNLPAGFYTQRNPDGELVLCYDVNMGYLKEPTPLTLDLDTELPTAESWTGDYHLVDRLAATEEESRRLFQALQPDGVADETTVAWCKERLLSQLSPAEAQWYQAHVFLNNGADGHAQLKALAQVYYRYGTDGLSTLQHKLSQVKGALKGAFWQTFKDSVLAKCGNFNALMTSSAFETLYTMSATLAENQAALNLWQAVLASHGEGVGFHSIETLWSAFNYFLTELKDMRLPITGDEFNGVGPHNMLVFMDRVLSSLYAIRDPQNQALFLSHVSGVSEDGAPARPWDMSEGGVPYAVKEGFQRFDNVLNLSDFSEGEPTYTPNLEALYTWPQDGVIRLRMLRALAVSKARFTDDDYRDLSAALGDGSEGSKHRLMWISHAQRDSVKSAGEMIGAMNAVANQEIFKDIAKNIHQAVYVEKRPSLLIHWPAMMALCHHIPALNIRSLLAKFPDGSFLEALNLIWHKNNKTFPQPELDRLISLASRVDFKNDPLFADALKLAALYHLDAAKTETFFQLIERSVTKPVLKQTLSVLFNHLLAVDFQNMDAEKLLNLSQQTVWAAIKSTVESMEQAPLFSDTKRLPLIQKLHNDFKIAFKISTSGKFQALTDDKRAEVTADFSPDYQARLWHFFQTHLAYPTTEGAAAAFSHLRGFFSGLENARTYFNEVEYLLLHLERLYPNDRHPVTYWNVQYFSQILTLLQPKDGEKKAFPFGILTTLLSLDEFKPTNLEHVTEQLEKTIEDKLNRVLTSGLTRTEQALFLKVMYKYGLDDAAIAAKIETLSAPSYCDVRESLLTSLWKSPNKATFETRWVESCLLHDKTLKHPETAALWFKEIESREGKGYELFLDIKAGGSAEELLYIMALSTLEAGPRDKETHASDLDKKSNKLLDRLRALTPHELTRIAALYSEQPYPTTNRLLRLLKEYNERKAECVGREDACLSEVLQAYAINPYPETRRDYTRHAVTREKDLYRMLRNTEVTHKDGTRAYLGESSLNRLTEVFQHLKDYEEGELLLAGKRVRDMTKDELAAQFRALSNQPELKNIAALWAVLFEVLGRTTGKYPHLAQQFALIANDLCINSDKRVLELATGEGKSHFVALRAAKNVGLGHKVDVCTAKQALAERDLLDYKGFFNYLGIKTACVDSQSDFGLYDKSQVTYTTLGGLSLLRDRALHEGITLKKSDVGLLDEADFIRFDEGTKTEFNYAISTGITPKQMTWFYQAINAAYKAVKTDAATKIDTAIAERFFELLLERAGDDESKKQVVYDAINEENPCIELLRSAHEAHQLERHKQFSVLEKEIDVVGERYTVQEIIPLSTDNQKMQGSTFSRLVQQLLAVRLNTEAGKEIPPKPQTFHVPPESHVLSSRVASQLMEKDGLWSEGWEGFTGTLSGNQAQILQSEVLRVPTNQRDKREWKGATFCDNDKARYQAIAAKLREYLSHNKSVLFACKNDLQVKELERALKPYLSDLQNNFIYYTNEDPKKRTPAQVLAEKASKPGATVLVASGFGRGDNVGVDAVFLMGTTDRNDRLQKGGRTARNGAEGDVLEFYCKDEVLTERAELLKYLKDDKPMPLDNLLLDEVMSLREQADYEKSKLKQVYDHGRSQLSNWGMSYLSSLSDRGARDTASRAFAKILKELDTKYIEVTSKVEFKAQTDFIKTQILAAKERFSKEEDICIRFDYKEFIAPTIKWDADKKLEETPAASLARLSSCRDILGLDIGEKEHASSTRPDEIVSLMEKKITGRLFESAITNDVSSVFSSVEDVKTWEQWCQKISKTAQPAVFNALQKVKEFLLSCGSNHSALFNNLLHFTTKRINAGDDIRTITSFWTGLVAYCQPPAAQEKVVDWLHWGTQFKGKNQLRLLAELFKMPLAVAEQYKTLIRQCWSSLNKNFSVFANLLYVLRTEHELTPVDYQLTHQNPASLLPYAARVGDIFRLFSHDILRKYPDLLNQIRSKPTCTKAFYEIVITKLHLPESDYVAGTLEPLRKLYELRDSATADTIMRDKDITNWFTHPEYQRERGAFLEMVASEETLRAIGIRTHYSNELLSLAVKGYCDKLRGYGVSISQHSVASFVRNKQQRQDLETLLDVLAFESRVGGSQRPKLNDLDVLVKYAKRVQPIFDVFAEKAEQEAFFKAHQELFAVITEKDYPLDFYRLLKVFEAYDKDTIEALYPIYGLFESNKAPSEIITHEKVAPWFNFEAEALRKNRIPFLRMLASNKLLGKGGNWSKSNNDELLGLAMAKYVDRTSTILNQTGNHQKGPRDLDRAQQKDILGLSNELSAIYSSPAASGTTPPITELNKFIAEYNGWKNIFQPKASSRKQQVKDLKKLLAETPNYEQTLHALHNAKIVAIESDAAINKHRWFKLNRQGRSRWLDTLSKMEDALIRSWLKEATAMPAFGCFDKSNKHLLVAMVQKLSESLVTPVKAGGFFGMSGAKKTNWDELKALMAEVTDSNGDAEKLKDLHKRLEEELPSLPGHLRTLANEVLARTVADTRQLGLG